MLVSGAREVIETDKADAERDGEAYEHDDEWCERDERPPTSAQHRRR